MVFHLNSSGSRAVAEDVVMLKPDVYPPPKGVDLLVLTKGGVLLKGKWNDADCMQWFPLPRKAI